VIHFPSITNIGINWIDIIIEAIKLQIKPKNFQHNSTAKYEAVSLRYLSYKIINSCNCYGHKFKITTHAEKIPGRIYKE
jgi:hypothetical protein